MTLSVHLKSEHIFFSPIQIYPVDIFWQDIKICYIMRVVIHYKNCEHINEKQKWPHIQNNYKHKIVIWFPLLFPTNNSISTEILYWIHSFVVIAGFNIRNFPFRFSHFMQDLTLLNHDNNRVIYYNFMRNHSILL